MAKDGRRIHVSISISPHWDASGRITGYSGIVRDITERKRDEKRVQEFRAALEAAVEGIARVCHDGRLTSVNAAYVAMGGCPVEELIGVDWTQPIHQADRNRLMEAHGRMLSAGKAEVEVRRGL
jgi:PAS domain-containing protein